MVGHIGAEDGLVSQDDDVAKIKRNLLRQHYVSGKYSHSVSTLCSEIVKDIEDINGQSYTDIHHLLFDRINIFFLQNLYGVVLTPRDVSFIKDVGLFKNDEAFDTALSRIFFINIFSFVPKLVKRVFDPDIKERQRKLDLITEYVINNCGTTSGGYLESLIRAKNSGILTDADVIGECRMTMINASSLSVSIMWAIYCTSKNKQYVKKIKTSSDFAKLAYMETIRLYPPFHMLTYEEKSKCPFHFSKRKVSVISVLGTHRSEHNWDDANTFDPNRFAKGLASIKKGSFIPFGGGSRACPGSGIAMTLGPRILRAIVSNFDVTLNKEPVVKRRVELLPLNNQIDLTFTKL
jgi:cytochrome P450